MNGASPTPWRRLSGRVIWVDLIVVVVTQLPLLLAIWIMNSSPEAGQLWPLIALAGFGLLGAFMDAIRWLVTRYRVTPAYVELKTGVVFRRHRSIQRDRIRSIDIEAKLRHRLAGLRVITIGAGQQASANEAAISLDALPAADARALRKRLLTAEVRQAIAEAGQTSDQVQELDDDQPAPLQVFARFRSGWVLYNIFNIWAFVLALGLVSGGWWLLSSLNIDLAGWIVQIMDWEAIGWVATTGIAILAVGILGVIGMTISYFTEYWKFELARVRGPESTELRTTQGLFTTREVNRDESRVRGYQLSQPLLWRWLGVTDAHVITTGLNLWSMNQPAAILPRVPLRVAREVIDAILAPNRSPFDAKLTKHPRAALRRRLWWATLCALVLAAVLAVLAVEGILGWHLLWIPVVFWPLALTGAVIAYRALGHAMTERYLVVRSGLMNRATYALDRSAVSTIVIKESLFQRRLGLQTVAAMSAAGYGIYEAADMDANHSLAFATQAAPGILDEFLDEGDAA